MDKIKKKRRGKAQINLGGGFFFWGQVVQDRRVTGEEPRETYRQVAWKPDIARGLQNQSSPSWISSAYRKHLIYCNIPGSPYLGSDILGNIWTMPRS